MARKENLANFCQKKGEIQPSFFNFFRIANPSAAVFTKAGLGGLEEGF